MKTLKFFGFWAAALLLLVAVSSCRTDNQIGFDISGLYGKVWQVDLGDDSQDGYPLYSEFEFMSGRDNTHGVGYESRYYADNDQLYDRISFDWEVNRGDIFLLYRDGYRLTLRNVLTYATRFTAYVDMDNFRTDFMLVQSRAVSEQETKAPRQMVFKVKEKAK